MTTTRKLCLASTALALLTMTQPALAQAQDAPETIGEGPEAGTRYARDEIIVTARKREESVLKVPVVETVLTAETLQQNNVVDISAVTEQVAGLQIGGNVLTVGTQVSLRGVGTSSLDAGVDQSVSLNIDGLQITQGASYNVGLFDMAQVEVLKGPQALFFGKNSPGGVIAITTADPGPDRELIARAQYGFEAKEKRAELIYSAPISDTVGLRLAGAYANDEGYFFNRAVAAPGLGGVTPQSDRYNENDEYILRGTLLWEPTSDTSVRLKLNNTRKKVIGGGSPLGSCPDGVGAPVGIPFISPNETCKVDRDIYIVDVDPLAFPEARNGGVPFLRYVTTFGTLEINHEFGQGLIFTSTSGYYDHKVDGLLNGVNTGFAGPTLIADNQFDRRDYTQELRLQSDFDTPLNFLIGGYYQDAQVSNRIYVGGNTFLGLPSFLTGGLNDVSIEALSAFGQLRYRPIETLEIAAGVRYTDEKRFDDTFITSSFDSPLIPVEVANPRLRSKNWSPELTITYTPTDDLTIFGALKQGYKSGSFIMTLPPSPGGDNSFGDERVRGGEVGVKFRTPDRAFTTNLAFYYYKYDDLQVGANEQAEGGLPVIRTINAASSKVYGVDFEASYAPPGIDGLNARLAVNYNHARFEEFDTAPCYGGQRIQDGCNLIFNDTTMRFQAQDLSGAPLPKAADWTVTGGIDYDMPVGDSFALALGVNAQYSSKFLRGLGRFDGIQGLTQPAYAKINANIAFGPEDKTWEVALIGKNLTDKFTSGNCTTFSAATGQIFLAPETGTSMRNAAGLDELACITDRGREVFVRLTLRPFGG